MQRAAAGLARRCAQVLGKVYGARVQVLVGAGNNGGDALFAAALLAQRGARVTALLLAPDRVHADGLAAFRRGGGRVRDTLQPADLTIDGILGIGGKGALRGPAAAIQPTGIVVAVDVPSGIEVDTGAVTGPAIHADVTVCFGHLKPALVVGPAAQLAGTVELVDIGLPTPEGEPVVWVPDLADITQWWPRPRATDDKYTRGVAGLATGSAAFPGAALLSTAGALAGPAGMVRYAGPVAHEVVVRHPTVVTAPTVADAGRVQAWLAGSGLGTDERARAQVRAVLAAPVPVVLDADALTLVGEHGFTPREAPTVVTPHDREFARVAGSVVGDDRVGAARDLAAELGVVVLLKGDRTIIAAPDGRAWANPTGSAALATAGTGDVLAGLLVSLLAAGVPAERAAVAAAFAHGLAGHKAAESGPVTASSVAETLPSVIGSFLNPTGR